jgi:hypothetical protein
MAVQIPSIQRIAPQAPTSVGRIQTRLPDGTKAFAQTSNQLVQAGKTVLRQVDKAEGQTIDIESIKMRNKYKLEYRKGLVDLKSFKGDPTEKFAALDKAMNKLGRDMLDQSSMKSPRARAAFEKSLLNADNSMQLERYSLSGQMHSLYSDTVYDEGIKEESRQSTVNTGYVRDGDETSLIPFQGNLNEMRNLRTTRSAELGTATEVPLDYSPKKGEMTHRVDGKKYILDDVTKNNIAEKESNSIYKGIDVLLSTNRPNDLKAAKYMMSNYSNRLEAKDKVRLNNKFNTVERETEAFGIVAKMQGFSQPQIQQEVSKIERRDPELASEVRKIVDTRSKSQFQAKSRYSKEVYTDEMTKLQDKQRSNTPYVNVYQLQQDPEFKKKKQYMDSTQIKAMYQEIDQPKLSNQDQVTKVNDMILRNEFVGMTATELSPHLIGLNLVDRKMFQRHLVRINGPESDSSQERRLQIAMTNLRSLALNSNIVPSKGGRGVKPTREGATMLNGLMKDLRLEFFKTNKFTTGKDDIELYKNILARFDTNLKAKKLDFVESIQVALPKEVMGFKVPFAMEAPTSIVDTIPNLDKLGRVKAGEVAKDINKKATIKRAGEPATDTVPKTKMSPKKRKDLYRKFRQSGKREKGVSFNQWLVNEGL